MVLVQKHLLPHHSCSNFLRNTSVGAKATRLEVEGGLQREEEGEEGEKLVGEARKGKITRPRGSGSSGRSSGGLEEGGEGRARGEGGREKFCNVCVVIVKKEEGLSESELI